MSDTMNQALKSGLELDAVCERYWNEINADGWSWVEMISGSAGNNKREREVGQMQADEIRAAMMAAIAPIVAERDEIAAAKASAEAKLEDVLQGQVDWARKWKLGKGDTDATFTTPSKWMARAEAAEAKLRTLSNPE